MKKIKKYPKFEDYDFSGCREITGDTLSQIVYDYNQANGTHLTVDEVAALSGIENPDLILPGQSIVFSNPEQGGDSGQPVDPTAQGGQNPQSQSGGATPNSENFFISEQRQIGYNSQDFNQSDVAGINTNLNSVVNMQKDKVLDVLYGDENEKPNTKPLYKLPEKKNNLQAESFFEEQEESYVLYFDTIEDAAKDFGLKYNDDSIRDNVEIATYIREKDGKYFYDTPVGGKEKKVYLHRNSSDNIVAQAHTHGKYIKYIDEFTTTALEPSIGDYKTMKESGISFFTFTPDGNMFYSGINGERYQYTPVYPSDPECPGRLNSFNAYEMPDNYYIKNGGIK